MKTKIFFLLIILCNYAYSQTEKLEIENLTNRYSNGDFSIEKYQKYANDWKNLINDMGGYPSLPYNESSKKIKFNMIQSTKQSKKVNYNRILEWSAINFGSLDNVLHYQNFESGKIIIKGWFDVTHKSEYKNFWGKSKDGITTTKCFQSFIFTIKDDKVKVEITDVNYVFRSHSYYTTTVYIPDRKFEVSLHDIYPITNFNSHEWKEKLDLLNQTNLKIKRLIMNLNNYIKNYSNDYTF